MANKQADTATALGIIASVVFAPFTGGVSLLGVPAMLGARAIRAARDSAKHNNNREKDSPVRSLTPYRPLHTRLLDDDDYSYGLPAIPQFSPIAPIDPDAILASWDPRGFRRLQERRSDENFLLGVAQSVAPAIEAMVHRHPCPRHLHISGSVRRTIFGGTKFDFDVDLS